MNKFTRKIKSKWNEIFHASQTAVTHKGLALVSYINNKYFTSEKPDDFIEVYHNTIKNTQKSIENTPFFENFYHGKEKAELTEEDKEGLAAFITVVILASSCNLEGKKEIYKRITDKTSLDAVKFFIAKGIVVS